LEYLAIVGIVPTQSVQTARCGEVAVATELAPRPQHALAPALLDELWRNSQADACGLTLAAFEQIVLRIGIAQNLDLPTGLAAEPTPAQQAAFFASLRMADLVLARACASGSERAWERFIALYREPLLRAGIAITGSESLGRELADSLYAELYGLTARNGERRCPLDSYSGRGSLLGWLRTTLAQRHVDHHRRTHREKPPEDSNDCAATPADTAAPPDGSALPLLSSAVQEALENQGPEEKFLLASYYLDGRKLHQIAVVLGVHEATISRKLKRVTASLRKQIVRGLERRGLNRRAAEEALESDPRDLTACDELDRDRLRLKELLQSSPPGPFKEKA
jgi:RNA polymerase sigma-70 factor (ECF subfamily)